MGCGFHLTAPSLTVRCPRVSVRHRNKAACGLVVLQATLPSAHRMPTCLTCSYADALADTQNKGFFGGCLLTLQFSAARWWESNTQSAEARLERRSSGLLPLHATLLLMVGGPVSAYPMYFQGTTRPGCGGLSRTQPVEAEAHLYYLTGEVTQRRWGRQPTRASKETALRGGKADLLAAVGLLVSKGDYFSSQKRLEQPDLVTVTCLQGEPAVEMSLQAGDPHQPSAPLAPAKHGLRRPRRRVLRFLENNLKYINFSEGRL